MTEEDVLNRFAKGWGASLDVGPGWIPVIVELDAAIAKLDPLYTIAQVKEKFGGLRFYINEIDPRANEKVSELIRAAEEKVLTICEICSRPGQYRHDLSWVRTLCGQCYSEKVNKK